MSCCRPKSFGPFVVGLPCTPLESAIAHTSVRRPRVAEHLDSLATASFSSRTC